MDYGMFFAYYDQDWEATPDEMIDRVTRASDAGFDVFEVRCDVLLDWDPEGRRRLREHAAAAGVELTFITALSEDADVAAPDPEVRAAGAERIEAAIELVDELGGTSLGGLIFGAWNPDFAGGLEAKAEYVDRSVESWRDLAGVAADHGVVCSVEVVNRFEQFMLNTAAEAKEFVERVDSPNLGIMLDTFHMNIEEDDMADAIETAGDDLVHFHLGENNRRPPQPRGNMPWAEIGAALRSIDYDGPAVMEPFLLPGGTVAPDVGVWRDLRAGDAESLDEKAAESVAFVRETFEG